MRGGVVLFLRPRAGLRANAVAIRVGEKAWGLLTSPGFLLDWQELEAACPWATPYQSSHFVLTWMRHYRARFAPVVVTLRSPEGCPWDRKQTPRSMMPYLLEETYEVLESIESQDPQGLKEELGDLLLHILFQGRMAQDAGDVPARRLRQVVLVGRVEEAACVGALRRHGVQTESIRKGPGRLGIYFMATGVHGIHVIVGIGGRYLFFVSVVPKHLAAPYVVPAGEAV